MTRTLLSAAFLLALASTAQAREYTEKAPAPTDPTEREIAALFDRWNNTLATGKPEQVAALYAENGVLQPTVSNWMRKGRDEVADYFVKFLTLQPKGVINTRNIQKVDEDTAIDAGIYTFTLTEAGKTRQVQARYTYVYEKIDGEWKIALHHSSAMPEPVKHLAAN